MTKRQIEKRLSDLSLRLERDGRDWLVRPNTVGSCMAREVVTLRTLTDVETLIDVREIALRD